MIPKCEDRGEFCLNKYGEHCKVCGDKPTLSSALIRVFSLGCRVNITKEGMFAYVEVIHDYERAIRVQCLPLDNHLDYALPGAIDTCVKQLLIDIDQNRIT